MNNLETISKHLILTVHLKVINADHHTRKCQLKTEKEESSGHILSHKKCVQISIILTEYIQNRGMQNDSIADGMGFLLSI